MFIGRLVHRSVGGRSVRLFVGLIGAALLLGSVSWGAVHGSDSFVATGHSSDRSIMSSAIPHPVPTRSSPPSSPKTTVPIGSDLADLLVHPARPYAYVADRLRDQVHIVDLDTGTVAKSVAVLRDPVALAMNPSSTRLYVGHGAERGIVVIDLTTQVVTGILNTTFDVWDIVVPMDDTLVVTTRSNPDYAYALNATDGSVRQQLCWAMFCNRFSPDSFVVVAPDQWLYVVESANNYPLNVQSFRRLATSWTWEAWSQGSTAGGRARDATVSADNRFLYVANIDSTIEIFEAHSVVSLGRLGPFTTSSSVVIAPLGSRVAVSVGGSEIHIFEADGTYRGNSTASAAVEWIRATPDGSRFVAIVGGAIQDVEILPAAVPRPISPVGLIGLPRPEIQVQAVALVPDPAGTSTLQVDGVAVSTSYDPATGSIVGTLSANLAEGLHDATALLRNFGDSQPTSWSFDVDATAPTILLDPVPSTTGEPALVVSGNASDAHLAFVSINARQASVAPNGRFSMTVMLVQGPNVLEIVGQDTVGNVVNLVRSVVFEPILRWFLHPASHFRIEVPYGWEVQGNATLGGEVVDVLMVSSTGPANILVASEGRPVQGTYASARAILQETLDNLSAAFSGFTILEGPFERSIDEHVAAGAFVAVQPSTYNVYQLIVIVVGPEWSRAWAIVGTMMEAEVSYQRPAIEATVASFDVLPSTGLPAEFQGLWVAILVGSAIAAAALLVIVYVVIRARRRPRMQPQWLPPPPPPPQT